MLIVVNDSVMFVVNVCDMLGYVKCMQGDWILTKLTVIILYMTLYQPVSKPGAINSLFQAMYLSASSEVHWLIQCWHFSLLINYEHIIMHYDLG